MQFKYSIFIVFFLSSCSSRSDQKIIETIKDDRGRIIKQVTEGFDMGEGSYRRTIFYDTLGRKIKISEIQDEIKAVQTFIYSDSSTYEEAYYDLGETKDYTDTNFSVTRKDLVYISHVRVNAKGNSVYEFKKWFESDSVWCQEFYFDSTGSLTSNKNIKCN